MVLRSTLTVTAVAMVSLIQRLADFAEPWQRLVSHSTLVSTTLLYAHLAALLAGGGLALAADRATWLLDRTSPDDCTRHLTELTHTHRPVLIALTLSFASGVLLFLSDVEVFATSPVFWTKMCLIALLLANGFVMTRVEQALRAGASAVPSPAADVAERLWRRRRANAVTSAALWFVVVLAGTILASR